MKITTSQAVTILTAAWTVDGEHPSVTPDKVKKWAEAGLLSFEFQGNRLMVDHQEVIDLGRAVRYLPDVTELLDTVGPIFRVSTAPMHDAEVLTYDDGRFLRDQVGVDYSLDPETLPARAGWEGVWPLKKPKLEFALENRAHLSASLVGLIYPGYLRPIDSHTNIGRRRYFHTVTPSEDVVDFLGTGIIIDVPGGPICNFIEQP